MQQVLHIQERRAWHAVAGILAAVWLLPGNTIPPALIHGRTAVRLDEGHDWKRQGSRVAYIGVAAVPVHLLVITEETTHGQEHDDTL